MATKNILIVDDDRGIRDSLARILRWKGHTVLVASNGEEALSTIDTFSPDCLLLDIRMPGMEGDALFAAIRKRLPAVVALFMTAFSSSDCVSTAMELGGVAVLSKPLDIEAMLQLIQELCEQAPVLIVDDDHALLASLSRTIRSQGIKVVTAQTLQEATRYVRQRPSRAIVADYFLEDGFGSQLLEEVAGNPVDLPFLLMSGHLESVQESIRENRGGEIRPSACLSKPIDTEDLVRRLLPRE